MLELPIYAVSITFYNEQFATIWPSMNSFAKQRSEVLGHGFVTTQFIPRMSVSRREFVFQRGGVR